MGNDWSDYTEGTKGNRQITSRVNRCQDMIRVYTIKCHYRFSCLLNQQKLRWQQTMFFKTTRLTEKTMKENLILSKYNVKYTGMYRNCNEIKKKLLNLPRIKTQGGHLHNRHQFLTQIFRGRITIGWYTKFLRFSIKELLEPFDKQ